MTGTLLEEIRDGYMRGWSFTPLNGKLPLLQGWQQRARMEYHELVQYAKNRNMGLRTGQASGIVVVDIEYESPVSLEMFPETVTVLTGSAGWHLYYLTSQKLQNRVGTLRGPDGDQLPKVDLRAENGQVVYPGSIHPKTGARYRWSPNHSPREIAVAPLPDWIIQTPKQGTPAKAPRPAAGPGEAERRCLSYVKTMPAAVSGQRGHDRTFAVACKPFQFGLGRAPAWRILEWFNENQCYPRWSEKELMHKLDDAEKRVSEQREWGMYVQREPEPQPEPATALPTANEIVF